MFENPRRGRQARDFTTNVWKILDLKSSSEQIFFRKLSLGAPVNCGIVVNYWSVFAFFRLFPLFWPDLGLIVLKRITNCKQSLIHTSFFIITLRANFRRPLARNLAWIDCDRVLMVTMMLNIAIYDTYSE